MLIKRALILGLFLGLAWPLAAQNQGAPKPKKPKKKAKAAALLIIPGQPAPLPDQRASAEGAAGQAYQKILQAWRKTQGEFFMRYRKASKKERAVLSKQFPKPDATATKLMTLASQHPKTDVAADALMWVAGNMRYRKGTMAKQALALLLKDYKASPAMAQVAPLLGNRADEKSAAILRELSKESPHKKVRALATYNLGLLLLKQGQQAAARKSFQDCSAFKDVILYRDTSVASKAARKLYELEHLAVGMQAPEIEGSDVEGVAFKLSDYRGKVVLLDFWGHW